MRRSDNSPHNSAQEPQEADDSLQLDSENNNSNSNGSDWSRILLLLNQSSAGNNSTFQSSFGVREWRQYSTIRNSDRIQEREEEQRSRIFNFRSSLNLRYGRVDQAGDDQDARDGEARDARNGDAQGRDGEAREGDGEAQEIDGEPQDARNVDAQERDDEQDQRVLKEREEQVRLIEEQKKKEAIISTATKIKKSNPSYAIEKLGILFDEDIIGISQPLIPCDCLSLSIFLEDLEIQFGRSLKRIRNFTPPTASYYLLFFFSQFSKIIRNKKPLTLDELNFAKTGLFTFALYSPYVKSLFSGKYTIAELASLSYYIQNCGLLNEMNLKVSMGSVVDDFNNLIANFRELGLQNLQELKNWSKLDDSWVAEKNTSII